MSGPNAFSMRSAISGVSAALECGSRSYPTSTAETVMLICRSRRKIS
jgi:hypothetical protein